MRLLLAAFVLSFGVTSYSETVYDFVSLAEQRLERELGYIPKLKAVVFYEALDIINLEIGPRDRSRLMVIFETEDRLMQGLELSVSFFAEGYRQIQLVSPQQENGFMESIKAPQVYTIESLLNLKFKASSSPKAFRFLVEDLVEILGEKKVSGGSLSLRLDMSNVDLKTSLLVFKRLGQKGTPSIIEMSGNHDHLFAVSWVNEKSTLIESRPSLLKLHFDTFRTHSRDFEMSNDFMRHIPQFSCRKVTSN